MNDAPRSPLRTAALRRGFTLSSVPGALFAITAMMTMFISLCCCCGGGCDPVAAALDPKLRSNQTFQDEMGELESLTINFQRTGEVGQSNEGTVVYDVVASKGSGEIHAKPSETEDGEFEFIKLVKSDGTEFDLYGDSGGDTPEMPADGMDAVDSDDGTIDGADTALDTGDDAIDTVQP